MTSSQIQNIRKSGHVPLFIDGEFVDSATSEWIEVNNPASQAVIAQVPVATDDEMQRAVESAKAAFKAWRDVPTVERVRYLFKYQALLKERQEDIARVLSEETGKTFADAMGDVWRGIEVVEVPVGQRVGFLIL